MRRVAGRMLTAVIALAVVTNVANAQRVMTFGITGGVNFANVSGNDVDNKSNLIGFFVGGTFSAGLAPGWDFYSEASWSRKGVKGEDPTTAADVEIRADYIDIPVMIRVMPGMGMQAQPWLGLGGYAAFNISCDIESGGVTVDCDDAGLEPKSVDFGAIGGVGLNFNQFGAFARYQLGLSDLADGSDAKNRTLQLGVNFNFWP